MLSFRRDQLLMNLRPPAAFMPVPPAGERRVWDLLGTALSEVLANRAEQALNDPIPMLTASMRRSGAAFARAQKRRREQLSQLVLGACARGPERYIDAILDCVWALLEESSWARPQNNDPLSTRHRIDAVAAETASTLALCFRLFLPELSRLAPELGARIYQSLVERVFMPLLEEQASSLELNEDELMPALDAMLGTVLLTEEDSQRRWFCVRRLTALFEDRIKRDLPDGGDPLGLPRHLINSAALSNALFMLSVATDGEVELRDEPAFIGMANLPISLHIGGGWFLNPGGNGPTPFLDPNALYLLGDNARSGDLCALASYLHKQYALELLSADAPLMHKLQHALYCENLLREPSRSVIRQNVALPDTQLMSMRSGSYFMALMGGASEPGTRHLDIGDICLLYQGKPILIDSGAGPEAMFHSVPTVGGIEQQHTERNPEEGIDNRFDLGYSMLSLGIAHAYPPEAQLVGWQRSLMLGASEDGVRLMDVIEFEQGVEKSVSFRFLTPGKPILQTDGAILLGDLALKSETPLDVVIEPVPLLRPHLRQLWGGSFYRLTLTTKQPIAGGTFAFVFRPFTGNICLEADPQ